MYKNEINIKWVCCFIRKNGNNIIIYFYYIYIYKKYLNFFQYQIFFILNNHIYKIAYHHFIFLFNSQFMTINKINNKQLNKL